MNVDSSTADAEMVGGPWDSAEGRRHLITVMVRGDN